jgi:hypothetical protein
VPLRALRPGHRWGSLAVYHSQSMVLALTHEFPAGHACKGVLCWHLMVHRHGRPVASTLRGTLVEHWSKTCVSWRGSEGMLYPPAPMQGGASATGDGKLMCRAVAQLRRPGPGSPPVQYRRIGYHLLYHRTCWPGPTAGHATPPPPLLLLLFLLFFFRNFLSFSRACPIPCRCSMSGRKRPPNCLCTCLNLDARAPVRPSSPPWAPPHPHIHTNAHAHIHTQ